MPVPTPTSRMRSSGGNRHPLNRLNAAGMQRRAERQVVEPRNVLVDFRDEIGFDDSD